MSFETIKLAPELKSGAWRVVALLCLAGCLNYLDRTMLTTMRSSVIEQYPMTDAQFGLLTSVFLWVYGILSPFAGFLADHFKRSRVIIVSLFAWSAVTWVTGFATTYQELLATRVLLGVTEACYIPAAMALIVDYHKGSTLPLATSLHVAGFSLGQSLAFLGGWIAEQYKVNTSFLVFGAIGMAYAVLLSFFLRDVSKVSQKSKITSAIHFSDAVKSLLSHRSYLFLLALWALLYVIGWIVIGWTPTFFKEQFNLTQTLAGFYATGYLYPCAILGVISGGFLTSRWARINAHAQIFVPVIGLCIAAPAIFFASNSSVLPITVALFMLYAFTRAFSDANIMPILVLTTQPRYRATGFGILNFFACVLGGAGLYAGGILRDMHVELGYIFRFASILMILCIVLLFQIRKHPYPEAS
ncbi:MFS transporter [Dyadobacter psychrotolerans]|uniref:MFS transporter n=1 Tax=Dyadobacter psychrotolerans TaxID=2541721 RepID=A0A4V2Z2Z6_9BACT|nr:MFS transporter [Dyadobacter psychrotolerans]TDE10778.1 MFS transporter [Dyadobacter psychrotolerans]